jgi:hypothetical protein
MSFAIKQNDRSPSFAVTIEAPVGTAVDVSGCTVTFIMTLDGATSPKVNTTATVTSAVAGQVQYDWGATDTDTAGLYRAEFQVTFANGIKRTFPANDYLYVDILPDLG